MNMNYKRLEYFNFKGVLNDSQIVKIDFENQTSSNKNIEITTKNKLTLISGKNAIGKTTILDAITFLFINKLWNGKTAGWESLDDDNKPTLKKPFIKLDVSVNDTDIEIKLENGKRYINGVLVTTLIEFRTTLLKLNFDVDKFLMSSNPFFILEYSSVADARNVLIEKTINDDFKVEVDDMFLSSELTSMYDRKFIDDMLFKIQITPAPRMLSSAETMLRKKQTELMSFNSELDRFEKHNLITPDEDKELASMGKDKLKKDALENQIIYLESKLLPQKDTCGYCGSKLNIVINLVELENFKTELNLKRSKQIAIKFDMSRYVILLNKKNRVNTDDNRIIGDIKATQNEITDLNNSIEVLKIYNNLYNVHLETVINKEVPFTLKMFHKNKSIDSIKEVFSITKNGVDYNFLNMGEKIIIGVALINYLFPDSNFPVLIDGVESLDIKNTNLLSKYKTQIIAAKVK